MRDMDRCSYTWTELKRETNKLIKKQCPERTWTGSKRYCIFHDSSKEKDIGLFEKKLEEKFDKKDYNFQGYYFPEKMDFSSREFRKTAYFNGATFQDVSFSKTTFHDVEFKKASFQNAYFNGATLHSASFREATFKNAFFRGVNFENVSFRGVIFENAFFNEATFQYISFNRAIFEGNVEFKPEKVEQLNLKNTIFRSRGHISADLANTKFHGAELENVTFINCNWPEKLHEEIYMDVEDLNFKDLEAIYRNLKQNMQRHGDYSIAGEFYYREMEMRRKKYKPYELKGLGQNVLRILCGYGEKPSRVIVASLFIILLGAILYFSCGISNPFSDGNTFKKLGYCLYYSIVTFTTLGSVDIHPHGIGFIFASIEAFIGAFFMALFVLVFGRKMMR